MGLTFSLRPKRGRPPERHHALVLVSDGSVNGRGTELGVAFRGAQLTVEIAHARPPAAALDDHPDPVNTPPVRSIHGAS